MKSLKCHELIWTVIFYSCLFALLNEIYPPIKDFLIWILPQKEPQLTVATLALAIITYLLVTETRGLGEIDKQPWLFLDKIALSPEGQFYCTFKNCGKLPIIYKVTSFQLKIDNVRHSDLIMHNNQGEVYQGGETRFTFFNVDMNDFLPAHTAQQTIKPGPIRGEFIVSFECATSQDRKKNRRSSKKYALEFPLTFLPDGFTIEVKPFEVFSEI